MLKRLLGILLLITFIAVSIVGSFLLADTEDLFDNNGNDNVKPKSPCTIDCTNLPIMMMNTNGARIDKELKVAIEVVIIDYDGGNSITLEPNLKTDATIKYRGNSSYATFDKLQYRLEFFRNIKNNRVQNYALFGMNPDSDWVLHGPFLDRSLIRNHLMVSLSKELMPWAPDSRFFELYVDDAYQGVYLAVEPIKQGEGRIELSRFGLLSGETPYIIRRDRVGTNTQVIQTYGEIMGHTSNELSIQYPGPNALTSRQYDWIVSDVSKFEEVLYSDYFSDPNSGYAKYIDVESFVDYYILNEFAMNTDASGLSTYLYKDLKGRLTFAVWDFNNAFNNYQWFEKTPDHFYNIESNYYERLLQDRTFVGLIINRYETLRKSELSNSALMLRIDGYVNDLGPAIDRNFEVWGYTFNQNLLSRDALGQVRDPKSYENALLMLKRTIELRLKFLDDNIHTLIDRVIN